MCANLSIWLLGLVVSLAENMAGSRFFYAQKLVPSVHPRLTDIINF